MELPSGPHYHPAGPHRPPELGQISTQWFLVHEPVAFVRRYGRAIQRYLRAFLKNKYDAEEVAQDFFLAVSKYGFPRAKQDRGRFRDYLKVAVRNAALNFLRKKKNIKKLAVGLYQLRSRQGPHVIPDQEWILEWRECLLNRAWLTLEQHQNHSPANIYYTALRMAVADPTEDSETLAARAGTVLGRTITAETFRKQLSRARRLFAEYLLQEVTQSLDTTTPELVEDELLDLGLMEHVRNLLPSDWPNRLSSRTSK